jgi:hypothetical protein
MESSPGLAGPVALSEAEFELQGRDFAALAAPSGLGWAWVDVAGRQGYLRARSRVPAPACSHCARAADQSAALESTDDAAEGLTEVEDAVARTHVTVADMKSHQLEYNIALHPVFGQPMLLILGEHCDGSPFRTADVWELVSDDLRAHRGSPFALTEIEHPSLRTPCFAIHPCQTADWMASLRASSGEDRYDSRQPHRASYITTWWSALAPVVNIPNRIEWYYPARTSQREVRS